MTRSIILAIFSSICLHESSLLFLWLITYVTFFSCSLHHCLEYPLRLRLGWEALNTLFGMLASLRRDAQVIHCRDTMDRPGMGPLVTPSGPKLMKKRGILPGLQPEGTGNRWQPWHLRIFLAIAAGGACKKVLKLTAWALSLVPLPKKWPLPHRSVSVSSIHPY